MAVWFYLIFLLPLIFFFRLRKNSKSIRKPPGPRGLPFLGNLHQFDSAKPHVWLSNLSKKYGPLMQLQLGAKPVIVISSAKVVREALKNQDLLFSGRPPLTVMQKLSYNGLDVGAAAYGEHWRQMKKISVIHLFSAKSVQSFATASDEEIGFLMNKISDLSSSSQLINLSSLSINMTIALVIRVAFGKNYGKDEPKGFEELIHESQAMLGGFFVSDYFPKLSWVDKLTGMLDRLEKNYQDLDVFYQELIDDHLNPNRPESMKNNVLDILIQMKQEQSSTYALTWDHIKAMIMDIFVAGTETTAASIVWTMTGLMQSPTAMKRLKEEIKELVKTKGSLNREDILELPYLDAVIKESFRLYPPTPLLLPRETIGSCTLEGYDIPEKTTVFINSWHIARDPENWENPKEFIPERFLNTHFDVRGNDYEFLPFGSGRRICPGIILGTSTAKVTVANLLHNFDWELPSGMRREDINTHVLPGLTMHKKIPLCLVAKKV